MLNKTLRAVSAKTVSVLKPLFWLVIPLLTLISVASLPVLRREFDCNRFQYIAGYKTDKKLTVAGETLKIEIADTALAREKGLSDRVCMRQNQAMLFVFDKTDQSDHCFWMKDMRFPLDILWLDNEKRIVFSASNVSPDTYPMQYCPNMPTRYVLELTSGTADRLGLRYDDIVPF